MGGVALPAELLIRLILPAYPAEMSVGVLFPHAVGLPFSCDISIMPFLLLNGEII
jgi:hypothetical protein